MYPQNLKQVLVNPGCAPAGNNRSWFKPATIKHTIMPRMIWNQSNFPENTSQKMVSIRNVSRKGIRDVPNLLESNLRSIPEFGLDLLDHVEPLISAVMCLTPFLRACPGISGLIDLKMMGLCSVRNNIVAGRLVPFYLLNVEREDAAFIIFSKSF